MIMWYDTICVMQGMQHSVNLHLMTMKKSQISELWNSKKNGKVFKQEMEKISICWHILTKRFIQGQYNVYLIDLAIKLLPSLNKKSDDQSDRQIFLCCLSFGSDFSTINHISVCLRVSYMLCRWIFSFLVINKTD